MALRTEADVLRTLAAGTYQLHDLYRYVEDRVDVSRDGGLDEIHPGDLRWQRRVRGWLQQARAKGFGRRIAKATWLIDGSVERPRRLVLLVAGATIAEFELRLQHCVELLASIDEPVDVVITDPPYGLSRGTGAEGARVDRLYRRGAVMPGYVDVPDNEYRTFTRRWVTAAADALRPGGQIVVVTGPQQAAIVQIAAEDAGLTFVSSIAARRAFALKTTRQPSMAHWTVTVMCRGRKDHPRRVWNTPPDLPRSRANGEYPLDFWEDNGRATRGRQGLVTYDNTLPAKFARRLVYGHSNPGELVVDPHVGGGEIAMQALALGRRFIGGDLNPAALQLTAARVLDEHDHAAALSPVLTPAAAPEPLRLFDLAA